MSLLQEIPASPFRVKVDPSHDASKVKAEGPGLSKAGKLVCVPGHPGGSAGQCHVHAWSEAWRVLPPPKAGVLWGLQLSGRALCRAPLPLSPAASVEQVQMNLSDRF